MSFGWTGFRPLYKREGGSSITAIPYVIDDSATLEEGDALKLVGGANGVNAADSTSDKVFGYCVGFVTQSGLPVKSVQSLATEVGTITYTEDPSGDTLVADSDNTTTVHLAALVVSAIGTVCSAKLDATAGTTTGSNKVGYYLDILTTDSTQLDESTATSSIANYQLVASNPMDSSLATDPTDPANRVYSVGAEVQAGGDAKAATA